MSAAAKFPHRSRATLEDKQLVATDTYLLRYRLPSSERLKFLPGQYVTFILDRGGKSVTRSYSFASDPDSGNSFELVIKKVESGFASNLLCGALVGQEFTVLLPLGRFVVHDPLSRKALFVATGTGIAPFFTMIRALLAEHPEIDITLVVGYRHPADLILNDRWLAFARASPNFHLVNVLSRPDHEWKGESGHVQDVVRKLFQDLSQHDVYICGVPEMVSEVQDLAVSLGTPKERVFVERY
ncbi:MAG: FAD-dependent oxidoreductase [Candidatus Thermoplasmatota archaeon]|jgi:NAD(P)H-flavin reductase|nr:FAD-dependent oxidoreductase [Candidatus Thermoplasmatota archaeon]MCL5984185.1 FAD-dependent oxidoreductase [Candidatus Thermoplasmatota archaeon]